MRAALLVGFSLSLAVANAAYCAPTVGVAFDDHCSSCSISAQPGVPFLAYIVLSGWSLGSHCVGCGLGEIDFRLDGIPTGWSGSYVASPLASFGSDPFAAGGATIKFAPVLADVPDCLVLYTLTLIPDGTTVALLSVGEHPRKNCDLGGPFPVPHGPFIMECPVVGAQALCDGQCEPGGIAYTGGTPCHLTAVVQQPWSTVKRIYE